MWIGFLLHDEVMPSIKSFYYDIEWRKIILLTKNYFFSNPKAKEYYILSHNPTSVNPILNKQY